MANSAQIREALNIFLQRKTASRAVDTLYNKMPTLELFFKLNGHKEGPFGLGGQKVGDLAIGRINGASAPRRENLFKAREYLPLIKTTKVDKTQAKDMDDYDNDPVVPDWDGASKPLGRFTQPRFKFSRIKMPWAVPHSEMETASPGSGSPEAQAATAIKSVYDSEIKDRHAALCERVNDRLFGIASQSGAPTDEDLVTWDSIHSIQNAINTTNTYGGLDRSLAANEWWRGKRYTSAWTGTFEDMIDYVNYDLGFLKKGLGVQIILVGGALMKRAKAEARAAGPSWHVVSPKAPEPKYGFTREMVCIYAGNREVFVVYEPAMDDVDTAAGTKNAFAIDPSTWTVAIPGNRNMKIHGPYAANEVDEGGDEKDFGTIELQMLLCCEVPSGNAIFTDVTP